jgi:hypothetical protein
LSPLRVVGKKKAVTIFPGFVEPSELATFHVLKSVGSTSYELTEFGYRPHCGMKGNTL